jgi:hypothetical protein
MGARPADTFKDVAFEIEHKQKVTRRSSRNRRPLFITRFAART